MSIIIYNFGTLDFYCFDIHECYYAHFSSSAVNLKKKNVPNCADIQLLKCKYQVSFIYYKLCEVN